MVWNRLGRGCFLLLLVLAFLFSGFGFAAEPLPPKGFRSLFNGHDLSGWKIPQGDNGHWKVVDGVIDYDGRSESKQPRHLFSDEVFGDYVLRVDWRIKETPFVNPRVPIVLRDGTNKKDVEGKDIRLSVPDTDSGIYLRGDTKAQVNIWCWPIGSGEVYGFRTNETLSPEVRAAVTPMRNADRNIGEWNSFEITMKGDRLTVVLNGVRVIDKAQLSGVPPKGEIGLQHHGEIDPKTGQWLIPPSLLQFKNIYIKRLN
jgi:hypothetical protein